MTCEGCSNAVNKVLTRLGDKVTSFDVNLERQLVMVETDSLSQDEVLDVIKKTGKEVAVASAQ